LLLFHHYNLSFADNALRAACLIDIHARRNTALVPVQIPKIVGCLLLHHLFAEYGWLLYIHSFDLSGTERVRQLWGSLYQVIAIFGGIVGFRAAKSWDGYKSLIGKAILFFSTILWEAAKVLHQYGINSLNFEQDLGIENLRRSKEKYKQHTFLKKYTIEKRVG
jgi:hypothetical protein